MTKRIAIAAAATVALALPAGALGDHGPSKQNKENAAKFCKALRKASGDANFRAMFPTNKKGQNAFGKCVSKNAKLDQKQEQTAKSDAVNQCKAERAQDPAAFKLKYGTNKNGKNAFGKCVSQHAKQNKAAADKADQNKVNAAKHCKAEQDQDAAAFKQKYGTNKNKSNAFGKCVSQKSKQKDQQDQNGGSST